MRSLEQAFLLLFGERRIAARLYLLQDFIYFGLVFLLAGIVLVIGRAAALLICKFSLAGRGAALEKGCKIVYYFVYQTVIFLGLDADLLKMLSAIVVAVFLAAPYWKKRYFTKAKGGNKDA